MVEKGTRWVCVCIVKSSLPYLNKSIKKRAPKAAAKSVIKIKNILNCTSRLLIFSRAYIYIDT